MRDHSPLSSARHGPPPTAWHPRVPYPVNSSRAASHQYTSSHPEYNHAASQFIVTPTYPIGYTPADPDWYLSYAPVSAPPTLQPTWSTTFAPNPWGPIGRDSFLPHAGYVQPTYPVAGAQISVSGGMYRHDLSRRKTSHPFRPKPPTILAIQWP